MPATNLSDTPTTRAIFNKVPEITAFFWAINVMATTVGETGADYLIFNMNLGLPLTSLLLAVTFAVWYWRERTLSIHSIDTPSREAFYWLAILFTFALGTAAGDLMAEGFSFGYLVSALIFGAAIAAIYAAWKADLIGPVTAFWIAYILTRPLGASFGDLLSQPVANGGLGLGTVLTSEVFLGVIVILVSYLALTGRDLEKSRRA